MPGPEQEGYQPSAEEMQQAEGMMTEKQAEMSKWREKSDYAEYAARSKESLKEAEAKGERILEIPVNISYTVGVPESAIISHHSYRDDVDNVVFLQTFDVKNRIKDTVSAGINEQAPEARAASKEKWYAIYELRDMIKSEGREYVKTQTYNPERARELVKSVREINEKFKCPSDEMGFMIKAFEEIGDKID